MGFKPLLVCGALGELMGEMLQMVVYLPKCSSSSVHGHMVPIRKDFPVCLLPGSLGV